MNKTSNHEFVKNRDFFIKEGENYVSYLNKIKSTKNLRILSLSSKISKALKKNFGKPLSILDLAAGPGNAGMFVCGDLMKKNIPISSIVFVDINKDRVKKIDTTKSGIKMQTITADIISFLTQTKKTFDVIVSRHNSYYFEKVVQQEILDLMYKKTSVNGLTILGSISLSKNEAKFLDEIHKFAMSQKKFSYHGKYVDISEMKNMALKSKFTVVEEATSKNLYNHLDFCKKFGLTNDIEVSKFKKFLLSVINKYSIKNYEKKGIIYFDINVYVLKLLKA